jgi:hypothetical protein
MSLMIASLTAATRMRFGFDSTVSVDDVDDDCAEVPAM